MLGFSKALVAALENQSMATFPKAHGITDKSPEPCCLSELTVEVWREGSGTFQRFNDVVARLNKFGYVDESSTLHTIVLPSANSTKLLGMNISLKELLSRIPGLERLFRITFGEEAKVDRITGIDPDYRRSGHWILQVDDNQVFNDVGTLRIIVDRWRKRHPFLEKWCLISAQIISRSCCTTRFKVLI
jgi:hypothetical protein